MANALLRMGDAALIINEVRSRVAVQGIINLLNTQPGVFLLYNLHAESLRDIQDRLELVFGLPAASMYATDRYTFLKKVRFGRKGRIYRLIGFEYESDIEEKKFVEVFRFRRGETIEQCQWEPKFLRNPEGMMWDFSKVDLKKLQNGLDVAFVPPAIGRRSEETGIAPEQYILQAFWKGKMYWEIYKSSQTLNDKLLLELDFVLKVNTAATRLLVGMESEHGEVDFADAWERFVPIYKEILRVEQAKRRLDAGESAEEEPEAETPPAKKAPPGASRAAESPTDNATDVEEGESDAEEEAQAAPRPTTVQSLRDKLKAKKSDAKRK
jgi:hypothetical protein